MTEKNLEDTQPEQPKKAAPKKKNTTLAEENNQQSISTGTRKTTKKAAVTAPSAAEDQPVEKTPVKRSTRKKTAQVNEPVVLDQTVPVPAVRATRKKTQPAEQEMAKEETVPVPAKRKAASKAEPALELVTAAEDEPVQKPRRGKWIGLGIAGILLLAVIGCAIGYWSAIQVRKTEEVTQRLVVATTQFELSKTDITNNNLGMAKRRLEYVIQIYPTFPGAADKLAEVMVSLAQQGQTTTTTTTIATPVVEATKDTRGAEAIYQSAQQQIAAQDWGGLYTSVLSLRNLDPTYESVKVDGMYYLALRNMGIANIQQGNLEIGIYQFTEAEKLGPIDSEALKWRTWATYYVNGASCWGVLWDVAVQNFQYLYQSAPSLADFNGVTATDRYAQSLEGYGDSLQSTGNYCDAVGQYESSLAIKASETVSGKYNQAVEYCKNPPATPTPTVNPDWTPTPTNG
jgi:tetratricopeptide (TPR) repeat protein